MSAAKRPVMMIVNSFKIIIGYKAHCGFADEVYM